MHEANKARAGWAADALDTFTRETYGGRSWAALVAAGTKEGWDDSYTALQDLIGDLLHVAVEHGWDPEELLRLAKANFDYENSPDYEGD